MVWHSSCYNATRKVDWDKRGKEDERKGKGGEEKREEEMKEKKKERKVRGWDNSSVVSIRKSHLT